MPRPLTPFSHVPRHIICHPYIIIDCLSWLKSKFFCSFIHSHMARQIRLFNPFSLQLGADHEHHLQLQRVIYYAESRFRQALLMFQDAPDHKQTWMQTALREELVSRSHIERDCSPESATEICTDVDW